MGAYLSAHRLPAEAAIDVLTARGHITDLDLHRPDLVEGWHVLGYKDPPKEVVRTLDFQKRDDKVLDLLTGTTHDRWEDDTYWRMESDNPIVWAIYGARMIGWERPDFPLKYSLPSDIETVCERLDDLTQADISRNVERLIASGEDDYGSNVFQDWIRSKVEPILLPTLRDFYSHAEKENQIVIHWIG